MMNPDFDPLAELRICQNNIQQLAAAYNAQQDVLDQMKREIKFLKNQSALLSMEVNNINDILRADPLNQI